MNPATLTKVHLLLTQINRLKAVHRAGLSPDFGAVEALFDEAADLRLSLAEDAARPVGPAAAPTVEQAARQLVELVLTAGAAARDGA